MMLRSNPALSWRCRCGACLADSGTASAGCVAMGFSVFLVGVGIPVIKRARGGDALEFAAGVGNTGRCEQLPHRLVVALGHRLHARVRPEGADPAANVDDGLVQGVTEPIARIPA